MGRHRSLDRPRRRRRGPRPHAGRQPRRQPDPAGDGQPVGDRPALAALHDTGERHRAHRVRRAVGRQRQRQRLQERDHERVRRVRRGYRRPVRRQPVQERRQRAGLQGRQGRVHQPDAEGERERPLDRKRAGHPRRGHPGRVDGAPGLRGLLRRPEAVQAVEHALGGRGPRCGGDHPPAHLRHARGHGDADRDGDLRPRGRPQHRERDRLAD